MAGLDYLGFEASYICKRIDYRVCFGGGILGGVTLLWWLIRRIEGMGMGDVITLADRCCSGSLARYSFCAICKCNVGGWLYASHSVATGRWNVQSTSLWTFFAWASILYILHGHEIMSLWLPGYEAIFLQI